MGQHLGELALDRTIRPRGRVTLGEVAASSGIDWPTAARLMTAVGFGTDPDAPVTDDEAATVRLTLWSLVVNSERESRNRAAAMELL